MTDPKYLSGLFKAKAEAREAIIVAEKRKESEAAAARNSELEAVEQAFSAIILPYLDTVKSELKDAFEYSPVFENGRSQRIVGVTFTLSDNGRLATIELRRNPFGVLSGMRTMGAMGHGQPDTRQFPPNGGEPVISTSRDLTREKIGALLELAINDLP